MLNLFSTRLCVGVSCITYSSGSGGRNGLFFIFSSRLAAGLLLAFFGFSRNRRATFTMYDSGGRVDDSPAEVSSYSSVSVSVNDDAWDACAASYRFVICSQMLCAAVSRVAAVIFGPVVGLVPVSRPAIGRGANGRSRPTGARSDDGDGDDDGNAPCPILIPIPIREHTRKSFREPATVTAERISAN